jgi:hypothetical protein
MRREAEATTKLIGVGDGSWRDKRSLLKRDGEAFVELVVVGKIPSSFCWARVKVRSVRASI